MKDYNSLSDEEIIARLKELDRQSSNANVADDVIASVKQRNRGNSDSNYSKADSFLAGSFDGTTLGTYPKVLGAIGTAGTYGADQLGVLPDNIKKNLAGKSQKEIYQLIRDTIAREQQEKMDANPGTALMGGLLTPAPIKVSGAQKVGTKLLKPVNAAKEFATGTPFTATKATKGIGEALTSGLGYGALYGLGSSNAGPVGTIGIDNLKDAGKSGLFGAALGPVGYLAGKGIKGAINPIKKAYRFLTGGIDEHAVLKYVDSDALLAKQAGDRLGRNLTPAEASGNPYAAAEQGKLGVTEGVQKTLTKQSKANKNAERNVINNLSDDIYRGDITAPDDEVINLAKNTIEKKRQALSEKAAPFYDEAYKQELPTETFNNLLKEEPLVRQAVNNVFKEVKYEKELRGFSENSIKVLDLAKKDIDGVIGKAIRDGNTTDVSLYQKAKQSLLEKTDALSPEYKQAREIYSEGAGQLQELTDSAFGKISQLDDLQSKNVGNIIFDRTQTNPQKFTAIRDEISKVNPKVWDALTSQQMQRQLGDKSNSGTNFYNKIIKPENTFKMYQEALVNNPKALGQLNDMKLAFGNLLEPVSAKTAARTAKSSLDVPRSTTEAISKAVTKMFGEASEQAQADLIFNPKWNEKIKDLSKQTDKKLILKGMQQLVKQVINETGRDEETPPAFDYDSLSDDEIISRLKSFESTDVEAQQSQSQEMPMEEMPEPEPQQPSLINKIAMVESNNNPYARSKTSSASGLLQFTDGTWRDAVRRYGKDTGITLRDKNDPEAQKVIAQRMLADNANELRNTLGREPTDGELYMTHFLGLGGTKKLLKAKANELAVRSFPKEAKANKAIFFSRGKPITNRELYAKLNTIVA